VTSNKKKNVCVGACVRVCVCARACLKLLWRSCNLNLITVQQDETYSVYYISVGSSTCFGCWHPSSGARKTVITASGID